MASDFLEPFFQVSELPNPPEFAVPRLVIFFSLTKAPLPNPTPTPPNAMKRTRNGPETDPKRSQTEPNGAETEPKWSQTEPKWTEIKLFAVGRAGGLSGWGGWGGCKGKRKSLASFEYVSLVCRTVPIEPVLETISHIQARVDIKQTRREAAKWLLITRQDVPNPREHVRQYRLLQNTYQQDKFIFELFSELTAVIPSERVQIWVCLVVYGWS